MQGLKSQGSAVNGAAHLDLPLSGEEWLAFLIHRMEYAIVHHEFAAEGCRHQRLESKSRR